MSSLSSFLPKSRQKKNETPKETAPRAAAAAPPADGMPQFPKVRTRAVLHADRTAVAYFFPRRVLVARPSPAVLDP